MSGSLLPGFATWSPRDAKVPSDSLMERARRRVGDVLKRGSSLWIVPGDSRMGDAHEQYLVRQVVVDEGGRKAWTCSCTEHAGGQYRKGQCSHRLAVQMFIDLERRGHGGAPVDKVAAPAVSGDLVVSVGADLYHSVCSPTADTGNDDELAAYLKDCLLPAHFTAVREGQLAATEEILAHLEAGVKVVVVEAPTGTGKTLLAELTRQKIDGHSTRGIYSCTSKSLQSQFGNEFTLAKDIRGRVNYPTANEPSSFRPDDDYNSVSCEDCNFQSGRGCDFCTPRACDPDKINAVTMNRCPYVRAKREAAKADLCVMNMSYFLTVMNAEGTTADGFAGRRLVVFDEADELETQLMRFAELQITSKQAERWDIRPPDRKTPVTPGSTPRKELWSTWLMQTAIPAVAAHAKKLEVLVHNLRAMKECKRLGLLINKMDGLVSEIDTNYVLEDGDGNITFKPVRVNQYARELLWPHGVQFLCMSASIMHGPTWAEELGLTTDEYACVFVPSTFDKRRRPIFIRQICAMSYKTMEQDLPIMLAEIETLVRQYGTERILIHSVSYALTRAITARLSTMFQYRTIVSYSKAAEREDAIRRYRASPAAVMVAPSLDRGVDFKDDDCRVVIIPKIPYPSTGDKQVEMRMHLAGGQNWYDMQTIRKLVQQTGRGMRHDKDYMRAYILDSNFKRLWQKSRKLFPKWWAEAVRFDSHDPLTQLMEEEAHV